MDTRAEMVSSDDVAAELTQVAYVIAHTCFIELHGVQPPWLELKLAIWSALRPTVESWDGETVARLAEAAYHTLLRFCMRESLREAETNLLQAFRARVATQQQVCQWHRNMAANAP